MTSEDIWKYEKLDKILSKTALATNSDAAAVEEEDVAEDVKKMDVAGLQFLCKVIDGCMFCKKTNKFTETIENALKEERCLDGSLKKFLYFKNCVFQEKDFNMEKSYEKVIDDFNADSRKKTEDTNYLLDIKETILTMDRMMKENDSKDKKEKYFHYTWATSHLVKSFFIPFMLSIKEELVESDKEKKVQKLYFWPMAGPQFNHRKIDVNQYLYQEPSKDTNPAKKLLNHVICDSARNNLECQQSCLVMFTAANNSSNQISKKNSEPAPI